PRLPPSAISLAALTAFRPKDMVVPPEKRDAHAKAWPFVEQALLFLDHGVEYSIWKGARLDAVEGLGAIEGDPSKAKAALTALLKDDDAHVRYRAASALRW